MSTEYKGHIIRDRRPDGKLLKKEHKGDLIKTEGEKGNPLWKDDKLNEAGKKKRRLNEDVHSGLVHYSLFETLCKQFL